MRAGVAVVLASCFAATAHAFCYAPRLPVAQTARRPRLCRVTASADAVLDEQFSVMQFPMQPSSEISPEDVVRYILSGLQHNDLPEKDAGLRRWFAFSNNMCRASVAGDGADQGEWADNFVKYARNPTFDAMVNLDSYEREAMNILEGTPTRGALATQITHITTKNGQVRRYLWTLEQERRPPLQGCWLVRQCLYTENAIAMTF